MILRVLKSIFDGILNWKVYLVVIVVALVMGFSWHTSKINEVKRQAQDEVKAEVIMSTLELIKKSQEVERNLNQKIKDIETRSQNNEKTITNSLNAAINLLQQRPSRAEQGNLSGNSSNSESPSVCTGRELSREDGEFLTREAARAEVIKSNLESCYMQYDAVKGTLEEFRSKNN